MSFDQRPIDRAAEKLSDVSDLLQSELVARDIERQVFPVANARHELNGQQIGQAEHGLGLALGIGV